MCEIATKESRIATKNTKIATKNIQCARKISNAPEKDRKLGGAGDFKRFF